MCLVCELELPVHRQRLVGSYEGIPAQRDDEPGFDYIRERLHGFDADELAVGSPFDYKSTTLVYLPTDIPEPNQPGYQRYVEQAIVNVAATLEGRTGCRSVTTDLAIVRRLLLCWRGDEEAGRRAILESVEQKF